MELIQSTRDFLTILRDFPIECGVLAAFIIVLFLINSHRSTTIRNKAS